MPTIKHAMLSMMLLCMMPSVVAAQNNEHQAVALVNLALNAYEMNGEEVFAEISTPNGEFHSGELYVFVLDVPTNTLVAHGGFPNSVGSMVTQTDKLGRNIGTYVASMATPQGVWVQYEYMNPATMQVEPKLSWTVRVDNYVFGSGIYE